MKSQKVHLTPQRLTTGCLPPAKQDALEALHLFESTGLVGLRTAAVAAMATVGQPLTGLFQAKGDLITEHLSNWLRGNASISPDAAKELALKLDRSLAQLMYDLVAVARQRARATISNYRVGAVAQGNSGALYLGFNIEFPQCPLFHTIGAEQAAVVNAMNAGESGLRSLALQNAPSGYCRQFLYELEIGGDLKILLPDRNLKLKSLLPNSFGPKEMGHKGGLLASGRANLELLTASRDPVVRHALEAACCSYCPYSHCPSGVALATQTESFAGSYCENAAFNPSLSPFHSAVVSLNSHGADLSQVQRVVLVERPIQFADQVCQSKSMAMLVSVLCPQASFEVVEAQSVS
jgi:cytidine deaminase